MWSRYKDIDKDNMFVAAIAEYIVGGNGADLRVEIKTNPEFLIEMCFVIVNKKQETVPFFINMVQVKFLDILNVAKDDFNNGKRLYLNFLILKGRQQGFTSIITAYQLACSITQRNFSGFTLADEKDNTEAIFSDKAKFPYDTLPIQLKPTEKYNNRRELHFEKLNSRWRVSTAGSKNAGRSKTLNFFHGSECGFWLNLKSILTGLKPALTKNSIKVLESTANGINEFFELWEENNNWECLFFEWWDTPEYVENFESDITEANFKSNITNAEENTDVENEKWAYYRCKWLLDNVKLNFNQLYWYFNQWKDFKGDMKQEYPCSADEAFIASGLCIFDKEKIVLRKMVLKSKYAEKPYKVGSFVFEWDDAITKNKIKDKTIKFVESSNGYIKLYEECIAGYPYVLGGDTKGEGSDYFTGTVINNITGNRCLTLHAYMESDTYAHQCYCIGQYYNHALISIESNFNTFPIEELKRLGYHKQYIRKRYDSISGEYQRKYGFKTDGNTRPLIIDREVVLIRDNIDSFNDIDFLNECLTFINKEGRPDAESGKHDDILFSDMIAEEARAQQIKYITRTKDLSFLDKLPEDLKADLLADPKAMEDYLARRQ
ncbi:MAG TPA: hypothetical protein VIK72_19265 [Clostridiaceae bacterium]